MVLSVAPSTPAPLPHKKNLIKQKKALNVCVYIFYSLMGCFQFH